MKTLMIFCTLLALLTLDASAQKYRTAVGLQFSSQHFGFTLQQRLGDKTTLEGLASFRNDKEIRGTLLAEKHFGIFGPRLNFYVGAGGHYGAFNSMTNEEVMMQKKFGGVDGILGMEFKTYILPLLISFDLKPAAHMGYEKSFTMESALSLRFVLVGDKKKKSGKKLKMGGKI